MYESLIWMHIIIIIMKNVIFWVKNSIDPIGYLYV